MDQTMHVDSVTVAVVLLFEVVVVVVVMSRSEK